MYKIRHKETGLFSKGGTDVRWSKKGKIWAAKGHLSNHLAQFSDPEKVYEDAEIVEIESIVVGTESITNWVDRVVERRYNRDKARQMEIEESMRLDRLRQYEKLRKEFG
jgi:hypothetical protein